MQPIRRVAEEPQRPNDRPDFERRVEPVRFKTTPARFSASWFHWKLLQLIGEEW